MKRFFNILLCLAILITSIMPASVFADSSELDAITTPHILLYEANSGTVLYGKDEQSRAFPASTTKIMTCIVALENWPDLSAQYTCGSEATDGFGPQSSVLGLRSGYCMTIRDLLYGLMLVSGNDCGACIAVATAGSISAFVELMNRKAAEIGMANTHFTNAHGLHNEEHYTTAYDMALLMSYALKNSDFRAIIRATSYTVNEINGNFSKQIFSSNRHIYTINTDTEDLKYEYSIGGKTGETNAAGYCLVTAAERDGVTLIAVLFGDSNQNNTLRYYRFRNARLLFEWGFRNFASYYLSDYDVPFEFNVNTTGFDPNDPQAGVITAAADISTAYVAGIVSEMGEISGANFTHVLSIDSSAVVAPVDVGTVVGAVSYYFNGELVFRTELVATSAVGAMPDESESPDVTTFISNTPIPGSSDNCNLTISKNGGEAEYTVWVYYQNSLYTMQDGTRWHYLYCDGDVFRASTVPGTSSEILLYQGVTDEEGNVSYILADSAVDGETYIVVSHGMALQAKKKSRSLMAVSLQFDEAGNVISEVSSDMLWKFTANGSGFQLTSNGYYLHRSEGDGLLFWILMGILLIVIVIIIRIIVTRKYRRRNPRRRGNYKVYRV